MKTPKRLLINLFLSFFFITLSYAAPLDNCKEYVKYGIPSEKGGLICHKGYALSHNPQRKTPDWVAEHLTDEKAGAKMQRMGSFKPDPDLLPGKRAELKDYKNSGYDRGHMAPAGDMRWDKEAMKESFYLSNIVPQIGPNMNRGIWKDLEEKVRDWAMSRGEIYIFTGPIYAQGEEIKTIGENNVAVPTHFYKVIFDPIRIEVIAFIMPNMEIKGEGISSFISSVDEVEEKTGLDFLSNINNDIQEAIESKKVERLWE